MKYFVESMTLEQIKSEYRKLCKRYHPDLAPESLKVAHTIIMQAINAEYALASANTRRREETAKRTAKGQAAPTESEYEDMAAVDERVRQAIEKIITLSGIEIEICGLWVWVGGDTKAVKDQLKAADYCWAPQKSKWYFAGVPASHRGHWDMDQIRSRYGSHKVQSRRARRDEEDERKTAPHFAGLPA